jgi:hypothetical protein
MDMRERGLTRLISRDYNRMAACLQKEKPLDAEQKKMRERDQLE